VQGDGDGGQLVVVGLRRRDAVIGALVGAYAIFDSLVLITVLAALIAWLDPLGVFLGGIVVITLLNLACCHWLDGRWERWVAAGMGRRVEARLIGMRDRESMQRPIGWITGGSTALFAAAAAVINPVLVIGTSRMMSGEPVGDRRIAAASLSYAAVVSTLYLLVAIAIRQAFR
jgi:hypothetical protein